MLPSTRFQIGHTPRCAARDYKETHHHWSIVRQREITGNAKELNDWAIENEEFFIHRFGFDTPMKQRRDIIELKVHLDLTDREIARLKTAGALTVGKGKTTCLCVDRALAAFGAVSLSRLGQRWYLPLHITDERRNAA